MLTTTVTWFTWFIALNYAAMAWLATHLDIVKESLPNFLAAVLVLIMFAANNWLGILWLRRLNKYNNDAKIATSPNSEVPTETYAFAFKLMQMTLIADCIVWAGFLLLFSYVYAN